MLRTAIIRFALLNGDANLILWINAFFCHLEKENAIAVSIRHVAVFRLVAYPCASACFSHAAGR